MTRLALLLAALLCAGFGPTKQDADDLAWKPSPGAAIPLDTILHDETGRDVTLQSLVHGRPVILDLGYFHCPSLCGTVRADLFQALDRSGLAPGDVTVIALSIDPAETPKDAAAARQTDARQAPIADIHYLTGPAAAIEQAVGFRARFDDRSATFLHPAGIVVLTQSGIVSGYLLGVGYGPGDLRTAVLRASNGGIARSALPVLLLCFHFDETTGRYTLAIEKVLRLLGVLTVLTLGGTMLALHRQEARR